MYKYRITKTAVFRYTAEYNVFIIYKLFITSNKALTTAGSHLISASDLIISNAISGVIALLYDLSEVIAVYASATAMILEPNGIELPFKPSGSPAPSQRYLW